jgi:DNA end-binding protein Ku
MSRPTWKGTLGFGLVQLLVELYPATQEDDLDFRMLDGRDLSPVGYQRINKRTKKEVPFGEIVKGVEIKKGKFVVVTPGDMKSAHPKATHSIDITDFVDASQISAMRWSDSYFIAPAKKSSPKAYAVLRDALRDSGKVGIAKVVLRSRQHLCAVAVEDDALVLALLRFDTELRDRGDVETIEKAAHVKATPKELELAHKLIETLTGDFKPAKYHDEYQDALRDFVKKKVKRGDVGDVAEEAEEEAPRAPRSNVIDLVAALKQSLEKPRPKAKRASAGPKKKAAKSKRAKASTPRKGPPRKAA